MNARLAAVVWLAVAATACGHAMFTPPVGPGAAATDPATAWAGATASCREATSYSAALRLSGRVGEQRIWPLSIQTALTSGQSIYMSATVAGRSVFVLAGSAARATLWLRREERVVQAPPAEIVEAMLGVSLPPDRLLAILTGCVTRAFDVTSATQYQRVLTIETRDARLHLQRNDTTWWIRAAETEGFVVEVERESAAGRASAPRSVFPQQLWIRSLAGREPRTSLDVRVNDAEINTPVPAAVFAPPAGAANAAPMTIEELRAAGPLREKAR